MIINIITIIIKTKIKQIKIKKNKKKKQNGSWEKQVFRLEKSIRKHAFPTKLKQKVHTIFTKYHLKYEY